MHQLGMTTLKLYVEKNIRYSGEKYKVLNWNMLWVTSFYNHVLSSG